MRLTRSTNQRLAKKQAKKKIQSQKNATSPTSPTRRVKRTQPIHLKRHKSINLDVAKRIVQDACIAAFDSAGKDTDLKPTPLEFPLVENEGSSRSKKKAETMFADFVSSTIQRTIANMRPEAKTPNSRQRKRSRKRLRSLPSKVRGLEHADSLHAMCSLFPVLVAQEESSGDDDRNAMSEIGAGDYDGTRNGKEDPSSKEYSGLSESSDAQNNSNSSGKISKNISGSHHSDHDSLLPPVGATSATTTPTKATIAARSISNSSPQQQEESQHHPMQPIEPMISPIAGPHPANASFQALSSSPQSQRDEGFLQKKNKNGNEDIDDDDNCSYERPLIGVAGDEGSGLVNRPVCDDCLADNHPNNTKGDTPDGAIIQIAKVGSVVVQKALPTDTAGR